VKKSLSMLAVGAVVIAGIVPALANEPVSSGGLERSHADVAPAMPAAPDGAQSAAFVGQGSDGAPFVGRTAGDLPAQPLSPMVLAHVAVANGAEQTEASGS
jgi:hypothetical protein